MKYSRLLFLNVLGLLKSPDYLFPPDITFEWLTEKISMLEDLTEFKLVGKRVYYDISKVVQLSPALLQTEVTSKQFGRNINDPGLFVDKMDNKAH